jgi:flagellar hook-associated protein 2
MSTSPISSANLAALTAPPAFSGVSKFASSLQQVLSRAVGIAALPVDTLEAGLTTLTDKQSALQGLDAAFLSLRQSVTSVQTALSSSLLNSSLSNAGVVTANLQSGASAGTYTVEVLNLGAYSTALTIAGGSPVADPSTSGIGSAGNFTLSVGGVDTTITPSSGSLQDLASAINSQAAGGLQASVVNVGSTTTPDYRLSLVSTSLGAITIDLKDSLGTDLISTATPGADASYKVDGSNPVNSSTRSLTLAPGLKINLVGQSIAGEPTTITVADSPTGLAAAFSSLANSYNAAVDTVSQFHGQGGGALEGDSLVRTLSSVLSQLGAYNNGAPEGALANFGITLDKTGHLSVDSAAFTAAATANFPALLSTVGSSSTGGFLQTATNLLSGLEDASNGLIKSEETDLQSQITAQQNKIAGEQARVNQLQTSLTAQISKADAAIASLESQVSYVTGLFAQYTGANNTQNNGLATL